MKASRVAVLFCCSFALALACVAAPAPQSKQSEQPELRATLIAGFVTSVAFSPDGKTLASGGCGMWVRRWDVKTGKKQSTLDGHGQYWVYSVAFSPDGKTLASGSGDETVRLWDVKTGK